MTNNTPETAWALGSRDDAIPTAETLLRIVRVLDSRIWKQDLKEPAIRAWGGQFDGQKESVDHEFHLAMALLSRFTFFGVAEVRVLLRALYRDFFIYKLIEAYRREHDDTVDQAAIDAHVRSELDATQFVGAGNPAESGAHILYYFRQESELPLQLFCSVESLTLEDDDDRRRSMRRLVLIDDICASGGSAIKFGKAFVKPIRERMAALSAPFECLYLTVCGATDGMDAVRQSGLYDSAETVLLLDKSHQVFDTQSRYFPEEDGAPLLTFLSKDQSMEVAKSYGSTIYAGHPLGHGNGQLIVGFSHNIPNNTLPIFWGEKSQPTWRPIFHRYAKKYTW
jgi:hypothetical protein